MANLHSLSGQFARAMGHVRLFAAKGVLCTLLTIGFNILFLAFFQLGIAGYVLANIFADGLTTVFIFLRARQWRYLHFPSLSKENAVQMLRYSLPLVPSTLCGWIINISDRYLIALFVGSTANGIYAISSKLPNMLTAIASIFASAWQLSALKEQPKAEKEQFFSNVFSVYSAIVFAAASGIILTAPLSTRLLAAPEYYAAWRYVPVLTLASAFACFGSFLSSIYMIERASVSTLFTAMLGAAVNVAGNLLLIRLWGSMGAAFSTLFSCVLIFGVRAVHTRSMLRMKWHMGKLLLSTLLLCAQCVLVEYDFSMWPFWSACCLLAIVASHRAPLQSACKNASILNFPGSVEFRHCPHV